MLDDTTTKCGMLIRVEVVMSELAASHSTDGVDEVPMVKILEPILVRIMSVGPPVKVHCRRVLNPVLITSILRNIQYT